MTRCVGDDHWFNLLVLQWIQVEEGHYHTDCQWSYTVHEMN